MKKDFQIRIINKRRVLLRDYHGPGGEVVIPENVTEIGSQAFDGRTDLTGIVFHEGIRVINWAAFRGCTGLTQVHIPEGLKDIRSGAFAACGPRLEIFVKSSKPDFMGDAFDLECTLIAPNTAVSQFQRPAKLCAVKGFAKLYVEGREIAEDIRSGYLKYIRNQRKRLYKLALECPNLLTVMTEEQIIPQEDFDGILEAAAAVGNPEVGAALLEYQKRHLKPPDPDREAKRFEQELEFLETGVLMPSAAKKIWRYEKLEEGGIRILGYKGTDTTVVVPSMIGKEPVRELGAYSLSPLGKPLTVEVRKARQSIISVLIPAQVEKIGTALDGCPALEEIQVSPENPSYHTENGILYSKDGKDLLLCPQSKTGVVVLSAGLEMVPDRAFANCGKLENVELPENLTVIGKKAFANCTALKRIVLPASIKKIARDAFAGVGALDVQVPADHKKFQIVNSFLVENGKKRKLLCALPNSDGVYHIPDGVASVQKDLFAGLRDCLREVQLPESVARLDKKTFANCNALERVILPSGLNSIPESAFENCIRLREVNFSQLSGLEFIGPGAFNGCESLQNVDLSHTQLQRIYSVAFYRCHTLCRLHFPSTLKYIDALAFASCAALECVDLPFSVKSVDLRAFDACSALERVSVQEKEGVCWNGATNAQITKSGAYTFSFGYSNSIFSNCPKAVIYAPASVAKQLKVCSCPIHVL